MSINQASQQHFETANQVASKFFDLMKKAIYEGPSNSFWETLKAGRQEFGHCVFFAQLRFDNDEEVKAFIEKGTTPMGWEGQLIHAFVNHANVDEFAEQISGDLSRPQIVELTKEMLCGYDQRWYVPTSAVVAIGPPDDEGFAPVSVLDPRAIPWWDTEAETIPYPGVTKDEVRQYLGQEPGPRLVILDTRNPMQAGENLNVWLDVCRELELSVVIDSETPEGTKSLTEQNRAACLTMPIEVQS